MPVYMNLIEAVHNNLDKMYRYVALRKKLLGVDELHMYDVYTPIVADADQAIPYEQAKETVLEALHVLGEDYVRPAEGGLRATAGSTCTRTSASAAAPTPPATAVPTPMSC